MSHLATKDRGRLDAFIGQCLDPLPDETLVDTAHNSMLRQSRHRAWFIGQTVVEFCRASLDFHTVADRYARVVQHDDAKAKEHHAIRSDMLGKWRTAVAVALLIPAGRQDALSWKIATLKSREMPWFPVERAKVEAAIAADKAWLAAHPTTRRPRRPRRGKAVQQ
ncbi:hypothetical protein ACSBOB_18670 [Mesorhizobium sp. ASY16-5R]|uniref:hypothetical protein n=1 Tax=Mesorhizobium sp. ASY16-5R TaxID=3445772 RepID=UPI003F9F003D